MKKILLIGNPNVGKSVIFSLFTKRYVTVSNYPGTTVEVTYGRSRFDRDRMLIIDTPGINNLVPLSEEERVTRDLLLKEDSSLVIQVADAKNLRRALLLSLQLAEMGLPFVLNLNMMDEAKSRGILIEPKLLSRTLGVDVVPTVAIRRVGTEKLFQSLKRPKCSRYEINYPERIEKPAKKIASLLPQTPISKKSLALMILSGDQSLNPWLSSLLSTEGIERIEKIRRDLEEKYAQPLGAVINRLRLKEVEKIVSSVLIAKENPKEGFSHFLGKISMHPVWGVFILLFVLYSMYQVVGVLGAGVAVDFIEEKLFGEFINPGATYLINFIPVPFLKELLIGPYGLITMALTYSIAIILPIVGLFFFMFGILEDSGYLPRLAIMVNRFFKMMGLNGKAVLPMVLGLGCATMATLTARILGSKKEKIIVTLLLALAVPCSAQLGVILGMLSGLSFAAVILWAGIMVSVLLLVGWLSSLVIPGRSSDFILEIPPIRLPQLPNLASKTLARIEWYLKEAVPLFILGTLVLFLLDKLRLLLFIEKIAAPLVVNLLSLPSQATQAFIVGFLRRDYGAAGLFMLAKEGKLDSTQVLVGLVTITLFVPCVANFFIIIKERGIKTALAIVGFVFPFAFGVGALLNFMLRN